MTASTVLYWISGSAPCWRILAVLKEKKLPFESKQLEAKNMKCPDVMAINPRGQMPSFKDGDVVVNESMAAMQYLEDTYPQYPLMPKDPAARGLALQRFHEVSALYGAVQPLFYSKMVGLVKTEADEERFQQGLEKAKKELAYFESYLESDPEFLVGEMFTLADINLALTCYFAQRGGATFAAFPHLLKYAERMKERESIKETWPPHWQGTENKDWLKGL